MYFGNNDGNGNTGHARRMLYDLTQVDDDMT